MASPYDKDQKWKRKRMLCARAEKMRSAKMHLEEAERGDHDTHTQDAGGEGPFVSRTPQESPLAGPSASSTVDQPDNVSFHPGDHDGGDHSSLDDR